MTLTEAKTMIRDALFGAPPVPPDRVERIARSSVRGQMIEIAVMTACEMAGGYRIGDGGVKNGAPGDDVSAWLIEQLCELRLRRLGLWRPEDER